MAGRWFALAVSGHCSGALDYSNISRADSRSILKEQLIQLQLEREKRADFKKGKALFKIAQVLLGDSSIAKVRWSIEEFREYLGYALPWLIGEKSQTELDAPEDVHYSQTEEFVDFMKGFK